MLQSWIAERLRMRNAANVSLALHRSKGGPGGIAGSNSRICKNERKCSLTPSCPRFPAGEPRLGSGPTSRCVGAHPLSHGGNGWACPCLRKVRRRALCLSFLQPPLLPAVWGAGHRRVGGSGAGQTHRRSVFHGHFHVAGRTSRPLLHSVSEGTLRRVFRGCLWRAHDHTRKSPLGGCRHQRLHHGSAYVEPPPAFPSSHPHHHSRSRPRCPS